jgi:hypothetical protein
MEGQISCKGEDGQVVRKRPAKLYRVQGGHLVRKKGGFAVRGKGGCVLVKLSKGQVA